MHLLSIRAFVSPRGGQMNCLTLRHQLKFLTLVILAFSNPQLLMANAYELPSEVVLTIDGKEVRGFIGDLEALKSQAAENPGELPAEGFVYQVERGSEPKVGISVWSRSKREAKILRIAEATLTDLIHEQQTKEGKEPFGYHYGVAERKQFGKTEVRKVARAKKAEPQKVATVGIAEVKQAAKAPELAPQEAPKVSDLAPMAAVAAPGNLTLISPKPEPQSTWEFTSRMMNWIILAFLMLVGVAWGSRKTY